MTGSNGTSHNVFDDDASSSAMIDPAQRTSFASFERVMGSVLVVTTAGFGGALAGLSIARTRRPLRVHRKAKPFAADPDLPHRWAVTCMGFATVLESVRAVAPVDRASSYWWPSNDDDQGEEPTSPRRPPTDYRTLSSTIGDYAVGGACAGAIFRGSHVRHARPGRPPRPVTPGTGALPGLALGFTAGCLQYALLLVQHYAHAHLEEEEEPMIEEEERAVVDELEARVRSMSTAELEAELRRLKHDD